MSVDISIIIPTYNRRASLKECLESIFVQEDVGNFEVIIVDDGSIDSTDKMLEEFVLRFPSNIIYVRQEHAGISKARNNGIFRSRGKIIAFIDDDCVLQKDWIEKVIRRHASFPAIIAIQGRILNFYKNNIVAQFEGALFEEYSKKFMYYSGSDIFTSLLQGGNCSFKNSLLSQYGISFRETLSACEDVDFGYQIVNNKQMILYALDIVVYHKHRITLASFIRKTVRDERSRVLLKQIWHKDNPAMIKSEHVDISLFYSLSLRCIKDYKFRGLLIISLHIFHKIVRILA